jgi:hypothetical protein
MASRTSRVFELLSLLTMVGCASVESAPGGPLQRAGTVQALAAQSVDVAVGSLTSTDAGRESGAYMHLLMPPGKIGGRLALADWLEAEGDWGWSGIGGELRAGLPEGGRMPFALSLGARSGALMPLPLEDSIRGQHQLRARLELYPRLATTAGPSPRRVHGILSAGVSRGVFDELLSYEILRDETRIEGAAGVEFRARDGFASVVVMPYVVAQGSNPRAVPCGIGHCTSDIPQSSLIAAGTDFGAILSLTFGLTFNHPN